MFTIKKLVLIRSGCVGRPSEISLSPDRRVGVTCHPDFLLAVVSWPAIATWFRFQMMELVAVVVALVPLVSVRRTPLLVSAERAVGRPVLWLTSPEQWAVAMPRIVLLIESPNLSERYRVSAAAHPLWRSTLVACRR